jgi:hypothetical protein
VNSSDDNWAIRMAEQEDSSGGFPGVTGSLIHRTRKETDSSSMETKAILQRIVSWRKGLETHTRPLIEIK